MKLVIGRAATFQGELVPPGDKSLTHRAYMLAAIADGPSVVRRPLRAEDCESTLRCLQQMGLQAEWTGPDVVALSPAREWCVPNGDLDCGNSGTTIRLLSGLVASRGFKSRLIGDDSLSRRPMRRIAEPLIQMGAAVEGETPPLTIRGSENLAAIQYRSTVASAQVKSCILLAGLRARGETVVEEPTLSRDHTERMLRALGAPVVSRGAGGPDASHPIPAMSVDSVHTVSIHPCANLRSFTFTVPGDISSAAFFLVAAVCLPEGRLVASGVTVNPTRTGLLDVLESCGVNVQIQNLREDLGEPLADIAVQAPTDLRPFHISGPLVPRLIDEIPVLAVLASQCQGISEIHDAQELRIKESDRLEVMADGLRRMGVQIELAPDGMAIHGPTRLTGTDIDSRHDHRIGMAFAVAGLLADGVTTIHGAECIATSFPTFESELERLCVL